MKKLLFAALIAVGGLATSIGASSAMTLAPAPASHQTGVSAEVQDVRWDKRHHRHYRHHHYRHHRYRHHRWYRAKHYHRGEGRDLYFHHDPHSQWRREHRRYQ